MEHSFTCGCSGCHEHRALIEGFAPQTADSVNGDSTGGGLGGGFFGDPLGVTVTAAANFAYGIEVIDRVGGTAQSILDTFEAMAKLAVDTWASFLGGATGASLEVQVNVGGTSAIASAGPAALYFGDSLDLNKSGKFDQGDFMTVVPGTVLELQTGKDPNGSVPDIIINVNDKVLSDGSFFFDLGLDQSVPGNQIDFYSVLLHEIGHGLGFLGLSNSAGDNPSTTFTDDNGKQITAEYGTLYDFYMKKNAAGNPVFTGPNTKKEYGSAVALEYRTGDPGSDLSHFLNGKDIALSLMNPYVIRGDRVEIGNLELAVLKDIGHSIARKTDVFGNTIDGVDLSNIRMGTDIAKSNGKLSVEVTLDKASPIGKAASSVAYEVFGANGKSVTGRVYFDGSDTSETITVDGEALFGTGLQNFTGELTVKLFNPLNAEFGSGGLAKTFKLGTAGSTAPTEPAPAPEPAPEPTPEPTPTEGREIHGTSEADTLVGGDGDDSLRGKAGDDVLRGKAGHDTLDGGPGSDLFEGGAGNDTFITGLGDDTITGFNAASETLIIERTFGATSSAVATELNQLVTEGIDSEAKFLRFVELFQKDGSDATDVTFKNGSVFISLPSGHSVTINTLAGSAGFLDQLTKLTTAQAEPTPEPAPEPTPDPEPAPEPGPTSTTFVGSSYDDTLVGTAGNDSLRGKAGDDLIRGLDGDDILDGMWGNDTLDGGAGRDTFIVGAGTDSIVGFEADADRMVIEQPFYATNSAIEAELNSLVTNGISGEAAFLRFAELLKTDGHDFQDIRVENGQVVITMTKGKSVTIGEVSGSAGFIDALSKTIGGAVPTSGGVTQNITGSSYDDTLRGTDQNDKIFGKAGNDLLIGGLGNDTLEGSWGSDRLVGGSGNDTFVVGAGQDTIDVFDAKADTMVVDMIFGAGTAAVADELNALASDGISGQAEFLRFAELLERDGVNVTQMTVTDGKLLIALPSGNSVTIGQVAGDASFLSELSSLVGASVPSAISEGSILEAPVNDVFAASDADGDVGLIEADGVDWSQITIDGAEAVADLPVGAGEAAASAIDEGIVPDTAFEDAFAAVSLDPSAPPVAVAWMDGFDGELAA